MITIRNLSFQYHASDFRLETPQLDVPTGEKLALIGPSGSGKTTLLNLIAGILQPTTGTIVVNGSGIHHLRESARRRFRIQNVGLVFQEFELLEHLTVVENVLLPCRITPTLKLDKEKRERARQLADMMGIADKLRRYVRQLSQGERQRVAVCRALLPAPPLLLCDEPTGNLDPANKQRVMDVLFDYVSKTSTTLVVVTHDRDLLSGFDRTIDIREFHSLSEASS